MSLKSANQVETNRVELEIEVNAADFEAAVSKAFKKNIGKINMPGFRKGKAPRHLVEKVYGESVFYEDAINDLYPDAMDAAIGESGYEYVDDKVDLDVVSVGKEGLVFKAVITVKPEVELAEYKGLKAARVCEPVTDDDVAAEIEKIQNRNSRLVEVSDRAAANDDTVIFDFDGYVDDVAFDGGKADNYSLVLGSGQFIPGFEEQIVGKNAGDEFDVNVTFPEDYQAEELAGKAAVFKCKLHEIKTRELPELNDDFVKDTSEFDTLDELRSDLRAKLETSREKAADEAFESTLLEELVDGVSGEIPQAMYENRIEGSVREFENRLQSQGLNLNTYLQYTGMEMEAFREGFREQAEKQVKIRLALEKVVKLENIVPAAEDIEAEYVKMAEMYKIEVDKIREFVNEKDLALDVALGKAVELIKETSVA